MPVGATWRRTARGMQTSSRGLDQPSRVIWTRGRRLSRLRPYGRRLSEQPHAPDGSVAEQMVFT